MALKIKPTAVGIPGILFTLGFAALPISQWEDEFASVGHLVGYELIWWAVVVAVLAYVRFAERRPVTSLGLRVPSVPDVLWGRPSVWSPSLAWPASSLGYFRSSI